MNDFERLMIWLHEAILVVQGVILGILAWLAKRIINHEKNHPK